MKFAAYLYGLFCVSASIAFAAYFPSLFALKVIGKFIPIPKFAEHFVVYLFLAIPLILALLFFIRSVLKLKINGVPENFSGWRYISTALGFIVLVLGASPVIISLLSKPATGSMSGIPLGLGFIFSFFLVLPGMTTQRK